LDLPLNIESYYHPIIQFEEFEGKKHLIYYEELITEPVRVFQELAEAIDIDLSYATSNMDGWVTESQKNYFTNQGGQFSGGDKVHYYKRWLTPTQQDEWDTAFREYNPDLYNKHLKHYRNIAQKPLFWDRLKAAWNILLGKPHE
jgi:hypothetical protein